ncbi:cytochrome P450 [Xylaria palmicola]|nr:cytochrome P450 [Xylaria palmicola]
MDWATSGQISLGSALLGIVSHLVIFIRGEWHMRVPALIIAFLSLLATLSFLEYNIVNNLGITVGFITRVAGSYLGGLSGSIILYRKYFHRLRNFPGPPLAATTKLWHVWKCFGKSNHLLLEELFKEYGPIVRTGPEELTIVDAAIPQIADGPKSQFTKGAWYDIFLPEVSINATRNVADHGARRRVWERGFSPKALAVYEQHIVHYGELLATQVETIVRESTSTGGREGATINVTDWFSWFAFDVMGEFAFSRSFQMMQEKKWHSKVRLLVDGMGAIGPVSPVPWLAQLAMSIRPRNHLTKNWHSLLRWCKDCMDRRLELKGERPDVSHWLIEDYLANGSQQADRAWLNGDAVTIIVAGSGTVSAVLVFAFYELARNPSQQDKLHQEIENVDIYDRFQLQNCTHLNAFLNETMRLHPPVPTGGNRVTPPGGVTINNRHIPGGVTIVAPKYSIQRLESSYVDADQFIPERWTTRRDMVKDSRGFAPFSLGKYGCIGKSLAMSEMRFVTALLLKKFEIGFQGAGKGESLLAGLRDHFTFKPGDLPLRFRIRTP